MKDSLERYSLERIHNIFGTFWVITYEDPDELVQKTIFCTRFYGEVLKAWKALHDECVGSIAR